MYTHYNPVHMLLHIPVEKLSLARRFVARVTSYYLILVIKLSTHCIRIYIYIYIYIYVCVCVHKYRFYLCMVNVYVVGNIYNVHISSM